MADIDFASFLIGGAAHVDNNRAPTPVTAKQELASFLDSPARESQSTLDPRMSVTAEQELASFLDSRARESQSTLASKRPSPPSRN